MSKSHYIAGLRAVEQSMDSPAVEIHKLYVEYQTANPRVEAMVVKANQMGIEIQQANRARLTQIGGEARHQGILAEVRRTTSMDEAALRSMVEARLTDDNAPPLLLLIVDGVQDPRNLGACLRSADAAGVDAVVAPRHGAAGLGPTVSKVAAGAAESLPFVAVPVMSRVLGWLKEYGVKLVGTSDAAEMSVFEADLTVPMALLVGREETGLRKAVLERCDELVQLPMLGSVSSLNVSVASGICLYEVMRQRSYA